MLQIDSVTRAEYDAVTSAEGRAAVVVAALTGTVTATVYDGALGVRGSGAMASPWATAANDRIVVGELESFLVTNGGVPDANWTIAFEAGGRWLKGSFGLADSGADFRWSLPTFATGQAGLMGTVEVTTHGLASVTADHAVSWAVLRSVAQLFSSSWTVNTSTAPLAFSGVPDPIPLYQSASFNLLPYVSGGSPPYTFSSGTLPFGVALSSGGTLTANDQAGLGLSGNITFTVNDTSLGVVAADRVVSWDVRAVGAVQQNFSASWTISAVAPPSTGLSVDFTITSTAGGTDLPFAFGHVFKQGDVPAGRFVNSTLTDWQCTPTRTWPDGSLRHAIIAGRATCTAGVAKIISLSDSASDRTGTALTTSNLVAAVSSVSIAATGAQDYTFDTASQRVGALLSTTSSMDEVDASTNVTVTNGAVISNRTYTLSSGAKWLVQADVSGGTVGGKQTVTHTLRYRRVRTITGITKGTTTRVTYSGTAVPWTAGQSATLANISGMTQLNGMTVTVLAASSGVTPGWVDLDVDSTTFGTYTVGGTIRRETLDAVSDTTTAFVRTGGGLEWDGVSNTYKASNSLGSITATLTGSDFANPLRTVCAGPVMSNWIYRKALPGQLSAWFDVRLYKGGAVEVFPWVEACEMADAARAHRATFDFKINGSSKYSASLQIAYRSRIPLLDNSATSFKHWSYWAGTDPQIEPKHDGAYMRNSRMVPNYGWFSPSETTLNNSHRSYTPNTIDTIPIQMGTTGGSAGIIESQQARYVTCGDPRAWQRMLSFGLSGGSWSIHLRDGATKDPFAFADYPSTSLQDGSQATGVGPMNGGAAVTHEPSYGYLPWLVTGRWWFLDESLFWADYNYMKAALYQRTGTQYGSTMSYAASGDAGIIDSRNGTYTPRGAAWSINKLVQTLAILPTNHHCYASMVESWRQNISYYHDVYVTHTFNDDAIDWMWGVAGDYGNPYGNATYWIGSGWMHGMLQQVWGFARDLDVAGDKLTELEAFIRYHLQTSVGLAGTDGWDYRRFTVYGWVMGSNSPRAFYSSWAEMLTAQETRYSLAPIDPSDTNLRQHSSNAILTTASSSWPYFGQQLAGLAYAVDNGVPSALQGWANVSGAANFATVANGFNSDPRYGIVPRI